MHKISNLICWAQQQEKCEGLENAEIQKVNVIKTAEISLLNGRNTKNETTTLTTNKQNEDSAQRHSQPEFAADEQRANAHLMVPSAHSPRPLSATNSDLSCDILSDTSQSFQHNSMNSAAVLQRFSAERGLHEDSEAERKRSSLNSTETNSAGSGNGSSGGSAGSSVGSSGGSGGGAYNERKRTLPKHQRPLTRYLPIFSPDLNLRHHIETAGHQLMLCPHVFVDAYSCRGYLHKLGATFHTWSRRWFVLDRQRSAFIYYADKTERKPRGGAYFSTIDEVYMDHLNASKSGRPHCTFIVKTKKRSYHLQAASDAAARIWIDAIITGAQGNVDY